MAAPVSIRAPSQRTLLEMQATVARDGITGSTLRQALSGTTKAVIQHLSVLPLARFGAATGADFQATHGAFVRDLQSELKREGLSHEFGRCAKALDIFMRIAVLHFHLRNAHGLANLEPLLYLPLDSFTMTRVRREPEGKGLKAVSVVGLSEDTYRAYQVAAARIAERESMHRVWLEDRYWGLQSPTASSPATAGTP